MLSQILLIQPNGLRQVKYPLFKTAQSQKTPRSRQQLCLFLSFYTSVVYRQEMLKHLLFQDDAIHLKLQIRALSVLNPIVDFVFTRSHKKIK
jgi:hypothetical protein